MRRFWGTAFGRWGRRLAVTFTILVAATMISSAAPTYDANPDTEAMSPLSQLNEGFSISEASAKKNKRLKCPAGQYKARYYANSQTPDGTPTFKRCEDAIDNDWGVTGGPGDEVGTDHFSVRWKGKHDFKAGEYTFTATTDDGVRIRVDGERIIDEWQLQAATTYEATRKLSAGKHKVKVEYYEYDGPAMAQVSWTRDSNGPSSEGSIALGAYIDGAPWDPAKIDQFSSLVGTTPPIVMWFQDWVQNDEFDPGKMDAVASRGATPLVSWEPWDYTAGLSQPRYALRTIAAGDHDPYIRKWARDAAAWGDPMYVRFAHEMNGEWVPWSPGNNGNTSADYVRAWRHIVDIFRQEGATNVLWVWAPDSGRPISSAIYPGDGYVDWVGLDGYNWGTTQSWSEWKEIDEIFAPSYNTLTTLTNKPVMLAETASTERGGNKATWIREGLLDKIPSKLPRVKAVIWFHENKESDWRVNSSSSALAAYSEVAHAYQGESP